jgi:transketolase
MKPYDQDTLTMLEDKSRILRRSIIEMLGASGSGHTGGSLSAADIVACLYFWEMNYDPENPKWEGRDRFVLSKGHAAPLLYAALAEKGVIDKDLLPTLRRLGSPLQGHPDSKKLPGVEASTGSLGQGFSAAVGMALAAKMDKADRRVYVLLGDGELEEGIVWEAAMAAAHYGLYNLIAIIDHNKLQIDGPVEEVMSPTPINEKFQAFEWNVISIDGHNHMEILDALNWAKENCGGPTAIIADTVKGRGVSFCENQVDWHGRAPSTDEVARALSEIGGAGCTCSKEVD